MLKTIFVATLYTAISLSAIAAAARELTNSEITQIEDLREGDMRKLIFHKSPKPMSQQPMQNFDGTDFDMDTLKGQITIVNYWATWCAPCRKEMPALNALDHKFDDNGATVLPIATGRNTIPSITRFFEEANIDNLESILDPKGKNARQMGVLGLPATIILSPEGEEIARLTGDADWFSESAQDIIAQLIQLYRQ